ncbi:MAG: hypothetical protein AAFO57_10475 [Pseudomonadota bacterium]
MDDDLTILLQRIAHSDRDALRDVFVSTSPDIYARLTRVIRDDVLAERALRGVYTHIWQLRDHYGEQGFAARQWLSFVTFRIALATLREQNKARGYKGRYDRLTSLGSIELARRMDLKELLFHPHLLSAFDAQILGGAHDD